MADDIAVGGERAGATPHRHRNPLCAIVCLAAVANALVPALLFADTHLFGPSDMRYRAAVAAMVLAEYAVVFLLLVFHANVGFASGYAVATAAIVTLGSAALTLFTVETAGWGWSRTNIEILVVLGLAFAVVTNAAFLLGSIRYARAIHPRLHMGGFFLGIAASLGFFYLYVRILG